MKTSDLHREPCHQNSERKAVEMQGALERRSAIWPLPQVELVLKLQWSPSGIVAVSWKPQRDASRSSLRGKLLYLWGGGFNSAAVSDWSRFKCRVMWH